MIFGILLFTFVLVFSVLMWGVRWWKYTDAAFFWLSFLFSFNFFTWHEFVISFTQARCFILLLLFQHFNCVSWTFVIFTLRGQIVLGMNSPTGHICWWWSLMLHITDVCYNWICYHFIQISSDEIWYFWFE